MRVGIVSPVNISSCINEVNISPLLPSPLQLNVRRGHSRETRAVSSEQSAEVDRQDSPALSQQSHIQHGHHLDVESLLLL